jgi:hypothetical protein
MRGFFVILSLVDKGEQMAHHTATPEFDFVAFDRSWDGRPDWTYTPRTIRTAKAKARREGYDQFYVAYSDADKRMITHTMKIVRYIFDDDAGKWIYS